MSRLQFAALEVAGGRAAKVMRFGLYPRWLRPDPGAGAA